MTEVQERLARYFDALDATQSRVAFENVTRQRVRPPARRRKPVAVLAVLVVAIVGLAAGIWVRAHRSPKAPVTAAIWRVDGTTARARVADIPNGVSILSFGSTPAFVVRTGDSVQVLLTNVQHLVREDALWWCPNERLFAAPAHGEAFSKDGAVIGGPAQRGLESLTVAVRDGYATARLDEIRLGAPRGPNARFDAPPQPWDNGGTTFCDNALKISPRTSRILSRADAIERVGRLSSEIEPGAVFAAKLITTAELDKIMLRQPRVPAGSPTKPNALLWLVEVHGRIHPEFTNTDRLFSWGYFSVVANTGAITSVEASGGPLAPWNTLRDRGR